MKISLTVEKPSENKRRNVCCLWISTLVLCVCLLVLTIVFAVLYAQSKNSESDSLDESQVSISPLGKYEKAAIATDNVYCSEIGRDILLKGGNAVDAAIAALFCIGIMNPQASGVGGGHFMTIYNAATKKCSVVDAREVAPGAATQNMYASKPEGSQKGWLAIAVPGELHGLWTEYTRFGGGKIEWSKLIQPTIDLMEEGTPTSHVLAKALKDEKTWIQGEPTMKDFINPKTKQIYKAGEQIVTRQKYIETLRTLAAAADPVQVLYNGSLTKQMAEEIKQNGGIVTFEDFRNYRSKVMTDEVIYTKLSNGRQVCGPPPPSGSAVSQAIIGIIDGFYGNKKEDPKKDPILWLHRFIEASKFAYGDRSKLSDMAFNDQALPLARTITSASYAESIRSQITGETHPDDYYGGEFQTVTDHGTTHITVIDEDGNAVSVTSTINLFFGAGVISSSTGLLFNDEMDDFSSPDHSNYFNYAPSKANFIEPGKRPMSSASPLVIFNPNDPKDLMAIGTAGGSKIITGTAIVALRTMWLGENVKQAIDAVRVHNQLTPNIVYYEDNFPKEYQKALKARGHQMELAHNISVVTAVERSIDGNIYANSDFRKGTESASAGF